MSCCGKRRHSFRRNKNLINAEFAIAEKLPVYRHKIFEYSGKGSLKIKGRVTGNTYYFRYPGFRIEIAPEDLPSLMAENDIISVTGDKHLAIIKKH